MTSPCLARSTVELAQQRAAAEERLGSRWPQMATEAQAFLDTLDWVEGAREMPPVSSDPSVVPRRERLLAQDAERHAHQAGQHEDAWYPGMVAFVLGWLLDRDYRGTPFM